MPKSGVSRYRYGTSVIPCPKGAFGNRGNPKAASTHLAGAAAALEVEGVGDDAHGQDAQLLGQAGHHGGGTGAGTAAHARGDEHQISALRFSEEDGNGRDVWEVAAI